MKMLRREFIKSAAAAGAVVVASTVGVPTRRVLASSTGGSVTLVPSTCEMCSVACPILVEVVDGRAKRIIPNPDNPVGRTGICARGQAGVGLLYDSQRLQRPLKRVGPRGEGKFVQVDWEQALDEIAGKLRTYLDEGHPEYLAVYRKPGALDATLQRFVNAFGTPNFFTHASTCPGTLSVVARWTFGTQPALGTMYPDFANARYIVIFTRNYAEGLALTRLKHLVEAKKRGAKIVVLDPRLSNTANFATEWVPIRPGTDGAFALGLMQVILGRGLYDSGFLSTYTNAPILIRSDNGLPLTDADLGGSSASFMVLDGASGSTMPLGKQGVVPKLEGESEVILKDGKQLLCKTAFEYLKERAADYPSSKVEQICDVPAPVIERIATELTTVRPSVVDDGWKWTNWSNGATTLRSILLLNVLLGNIDKKGGLCYSKRFSLGALPKPPRPFPDMKAIKVDRVKERPVAADMPHRLFHDSILQGNPYPVRALLTHAVNPLLNIPDAAKTIEALNKLELYVAVDIQASSSAMYADYVLPEHTYLESRAIMAPYMTPYPTVSVVQPAVEPVYDTRPGSWIISELAKRLGFGDFFSYTFEEEASSILAPIGVSLDGLKKSGLYVDVQPAERFYEQVPYKNAPPLPLPSGRIELYSVQFAMAASKIGMGPLDVALPNFIPPKAAPVKEDEFYLLTGRSPIHTDSSTENNPLLNPLLSENSLMVNADRAKGLGFANGDYVEVESLTTGATARARLCIRDTIREDAAFTYYGFGQTSSYLGRAYKKGFAVSPLLGVHEDPLSGGAGLNETVVRIRRAV